MKKSQNERWEKIRKRGKSNYILRYGVIGWGIPMAITFSLLSGYDKFGLYFLKQKIFYADMAICFLIMLLGGYCWGWIMWRIMEKAYAKQ